MGETRIRGPLWKQIDDYIEALADIKIPSGNKLILPIENDAAHPSLSFGDGNTGFYEISDNILGISVGGSLKWRFASTRMFSSYSTSAPSIIFGESSATVPIFTFNGDQDSGIGRNAADQLSLIAGGVEGIRIAESAGDIVLTSPATVTECVKIDAGHYGNPSTNPPSTFVAGGVEGAQFTVGTDLARYKCPIPTDYAGGAMELKLYWTRSTGGDESGKTVKWQVRETSLYPGQNLDGVDSTLSVQDTYDHSGVVEVLMYETSGLVIPASTAGYAHSFEVKAITPTGTALSEPVLLYGCLAYTAKVLQ